MIVFSSKSGRNEAPSVFDFEVSLVSGTALPKMPRTSSSREAHAVQFNFCRLLSADQKDMSLFHERIFARQRPVPPSCVSPSLSARPPCKHRGHWLEHLLWAGTTCRITIVASAHPVRIQHTNIFQKQSNIRRHTLLSALKE